MEYLLLPTLRRADKISDRTRAIIMGAFGCLREFIFFAVRFRSRVDSFVRSCAFFRSRNIGRRGIFNSNCSTDIIDE